MQVQVFIGKAGDGMTSKLQETHDRLIAAGMNNPIIQAGAYGEDGLLQILKVLEWRSCTEDEPIFEDLVIHLARQD